MQHRGQKGQSVLARAGVESVTHMETNIAIPICVIFITYDVPMSQRVMTCYEGLKCSKLAKYFSLLRRVEIGQSEVTTRASYM